MAIICRDSNAFRRNVLPILRDLVGIDVVYKSNLSVVELWGRKIHVIGCHDARSEGKLRGCTLQSALVDEATLIPESSWIILLQRTAMNNARIFATTNPDSPRHWLKVDYIDHNPDSKCFNFGLLDNPKLTQDEREFLERQHTGVWYKRFIAGEWCMAEGAVFDFFDEKIHTIQKPPGMANFYLVGVDVGFTNPTGFVLLGCNDQLNPPLWVEREYYWDSKKQGRQKTDAEYSQDLFEFIGNAPVKFIYIDPAAASFKVEMRKSGIKIPIRDAKNDVSEGIKMLSSLLAMGDLKILRTCRNLIGEVQGYCWDSKAAERGEDAPIKRADHLVDSLKYCVFSYFGDKTKISAPKPEDIDMSPLGRLRSLGDQYPGPKVYPSQYMPDIRDINSNRFNYSQRKDSGF